MLLSGCALKPLLVSEIYFFSLKILQEFTWHLGDCVFVYTRPQVNTGVMFSGIPTSGSFWAWVILTRGGNIPDDCPWPIYLLQDRAGYAVTVTICLLAVYV